MDDFRKIMYGVLAAFVGVLVVWIGIVYVSACGLSFSCRRGQAMPEHTPIPTLAAATLPAPDFSVVAVSPAVKKCRVAAVNLIGAWVSAGYSETEPFTFTDADGLSCEATFTQDVQPLFLESNLWYPGSLACASCHQPDIAVASAQMDLSSYAGMLLGSRRAAPDAQGNDIFGGGDWQASLLYDVLYTRKFMPLGRPPDVPAEGPLIFAGTTVQGAMPGATPTP
ncbi:MAG: hypothetical protein Fur0043_25740 [Anaerolineales bacterium]